MLGHINPCLKNSKIKKKENREGWEKNDLKIFLNDFFYKVIHYIKFSAMKIPVNILRITVSMFKVVDKVTQSYNV